MEQEKLEDMAVKSGPVGADDINTDDEVRNSLLLLSIACRSVDVHFNFTGDHCPRFAQSDNDIRIFLAASLASIKHRNSIMPCKLRQFTPTATQMDALLLVTILLLIGTTTTA
jgi:hypothetical protein